ncbi:MAG: hypothetical protein ACUVQG_05525 [Thermogutta sp.]
MRCNRSPQCATSLALMAVTLSLTFLGERLMFAQQVSYPDRWVWVFGWGLERDSDVSEVVSLLDRAGKSGFTGAAVSFGLDSLCKRDENYFRRLETVKAACARNNLELIPSIFSVGYGGGILGHNRYLAEGLPVKDALFAVQNNEARLIPDPPVTIQNGGFEEFSGQRFVGWRFHDQPGEVSFVDTQVRHSGKASLRMENFQANEHGHGRVMQEVKVHPYRCYKMTLWVKTENLQPVRAFMVQVLAGNQALAPISFDLPATSDWTKLVLIFNSHKFDVVRVYAGVWGGRSGKFWVDDWSIEEMGPINVLRRAGTPVVVRSEDGSMVYEEGRDYKRLEDPNYSPYRVDRPAPVVQLAPGSRIQNGQRLRISWYHSQKIHDSQVTVCMAEPELYEIFDHEAALLAKHVNPKKVILSMDEVRMGGTCAACQGRDMAQLLGECITKQVQILRKHMPQLEIYIWSDMLDPNHNAHGDYYLVEGDFTGSWKYVPKDLVIAVWGGAPRPKSVQFFAEQGFPMIIACYYDAPNLEDVKGWLNLVQGVPNVRGFMYTPWTKKYDLLDAFGELISGK